MISILLAAIVLLLVKRNSSKNRIPFPWLHTLFFVSGFPALLYQIVWQRALFTIYGVNLESVTVIVTAFMLGLGMGTLAGGFLSRFKGISPLFLFGAFELGTAVYGFLSLHIFKWAAEYTAGAPLLKTAFCSFGLIIVPTIFMGATLPLLVAHLVKARPNVGFAVGSLYFVNTLGSAAACFAAADVALRLWGLSGTILLATCLNIVVGLSIVTMVGRAKFAGPALMEEMPGRHDTSCTPFLRLSFAAVLVGISGFVSLGYEIIWYREISFSTGSDPRSFPYMLGAFLIGIASSAFLVDRLCRSNRVSPRTLVLLLTIAVSLGSLLAFLTTPAFAAFLSVISKEQVVLSFSHLDWLTGFCGRVLIFAPPAALLGATFPVIAHASVSARRAGMGVSLLYASDILGSVLGSSLVGLLLMNHLRLNQICLLLALLGFGLAGLMLLSLRLPRTPLLMGCAVLVFCAIGSWLATPSLFFRIYDRLQWKFQFRPANYSQCTVENRNGVVLVTGNGTVWGNGAYDGAFNTGLVKDPNLVLRAYALSEFHPNPRHVLMIGLGSGSWAQVIAHNPYVEKVTIVEINPGYLDLIRQYPAVATLIRNPKVSIIIDDGRRWMLSHPDAKFDAVVMNSMLHWREYASNLLSVEFLYLIRAHLSPGGIAYYNTTGSPESLLTAATVFPYSIRFVNFVFVADSPFQLDSERWKQVLTNYQIDGEKVLDLSRAPDMAKLKEILALPSTMANTGTDLSSPFISMEDGSSLRRRYAGLRLVTDDNMAAEW